MSDYWADQFEFPFEDDNEDICRNHHGGESFSEQANDSVAPSKEIQRERIMSHLKRVGDATSDECEIALTMPHQTASARFSELKRAGRIVPVLDETGKRISRLTRNNRSAGVYRLRVKPSANVQESIE